MKRRLCQIYPFFLLLFAGACALPQSPAPEPDQRCPIVNFAKWERVRESEVRYPSFAPAGQESLHGLPNESDAAAYLSLLREWRELAAKLAANPAPLPALLPAAARRAQAEAVNIFFNQKEYTSDKKAWGEDEYWATPREFMARSGDCEDYAIAKYYALRSLGFTPGELRLAGVWNSRRGEAHAVLLVYINAAPFILDNYSNELRRPAELPHYRMQYYVNEEELWLLRKNP